MNNDYPRPDGRVRVLTIAEQSALLAPFGRWPSQPEILDANLSVVRSGKRKRVPFIPRPNWMAWLIAKHPQHSSTISAQQEQQQRQQKVAA